MQATTMRTQAPLISRLKDALGSLSARLLVAFLLLIGVMLVAEGMGTHVNKGYIYVAMAFSLFVEMLNIYYRKKVKA